MPPEKRGGTGAGRPTPPRPAALADLDPSRRRFAEAAGVSRETLERLDRFVSLLLEWQAKTNLVAPSTLPDLWSRHIGDSLHLHAVAPAPARWVDLGSGAGFPGLVVAILRAGRPGAHVDLVESNAKKAAFLRAVIRETGVAAAVHPVRIEDSAAILAVAEAVSARALAPLGTLFGFVAGRLANGVPCYFMKGRRHEEEIAEAAAHWRFGMVKHASPIEAGAAILEVRDIAPLTEGAQ